MGLPHFDELVGTIDGVNQTFYAPLAYTPNTTAALLNGQMKKKSFIDGWSESNPALGEITLNEAPRVGDVVHLFYLDTTDAVFVEEITEISGTLADTDLLSGNIAEADTLAGSLEDQSMLDGRLTDVDFLTGAIADADQLVGVLEEC